MLLESVFYAISKGLSYVDGQIIGVKGKVLKPIRNGGLPVVKIPDFDGKFFAVQYARLVYYFETNDPTSLLEEYDVVYLDGDRGNHSLSNLSVVPHSTRNWKTAKITEHDARVICDRYECRKTASSRKKYGTTNFTTLAKEYGVTPATIKRIVNDA